LYSTSGTLPRRRLPENGVQASATFGFIGSSERTYHQEPLLRRLRRNPLLVVSCGSSGQRLPARPEVGQPVLRVSHRTRRAVVHGPRAVRQELVVSSSFESPPRNSAGVQISILPSPSRSSNSYIRGSSCAFAICLQFSVKRYSTSPRAAAATCNASAAAFRGIVWAASRRAASASVSGVMSTKGSPSSSFSRSAAAVGALGVSEPAKIARRSSHRNWEKL